jgi:hypothetical protein
VVHYLLAAKVTIPAQPYRDVSELRFISRYTTHDIRRKTMSRQLRILALLFFGIALAVALAMFSSDNTSAASPQAVPAAGVAAQACDPSGSVDGTATPSTVLPGQSVRFVARGFAPGEGISFWFTDPSGDVFGTARPLCCAPSNGVLDFGSLVLDDEFYDEPGRWALTVAGSSSRHQSIIYFCAVRQVQPTNTPVPPTSVPPTAAPSTAVPPSTVPATAVPPTSAPVATVQVPGTNARVFPETGKIVTGLFLDYWNANGGLAQQGYPISPVMGEISDLDGKPYTLQYFERAVFEYHPEQQDPKYKVLLSQLGTFRYKQKYPSGAPDQKANTSPGTILFPETGKHVGGRFLEYWQKNGGLAQQGYPLSEEFTEVSDLNGKPYTVQYFERAVFEMHPENPPPYDVLLSQLGTFRYQAKYNGK